MIHILLDLIADELIVLIIDLHFIRIKLHKRLCPIIHSGHHDPSSFSLIHTDAAHVRQGTAGSLSGDRLTALCIRNRIIAWNFFNKEINRFGRNDDFRIFFQSFHSTQKRNRLIMPSVIQSHLRLIVRRYDRPGLIFIFMDNIAQAGDRSIHHKTAGEIGLFDHMILEHSHQNRCRNSQRHSIPYQPQFPQRQHHIQQSVCQCRKSRTEQINIINTASCSIHQRRQSKQVGTQQNGHNPHTESHGHQHRSVFCLPENTEYKSKQKQQCKRCQDHVTDIFHIQFNNKFQDSTAHFR